MGNKNSSRKQSPKEVPPPPRPPPVETATNVHRVFSVTSLFTDINMYYLIDHREIGHGQYGIVRTATQKSSGEKVAVKSIPKEKVHDMSRLRSEIEILERLSHPNIVKFEGKFEDARYFHIVTELCDGGELFERIIEKTKYTEAEAAQVLRDLLSAIKYCHSQNIVHRDLKPENLLYLTKSDSSPIKIIDFGLSKIYREDESLKTRVGTPFYIAPEIMTKNYGKECDLWSIGVILYILLCGYPPFYGNSDAEILRKVQKGQYDISNKDWENVSNDAKDLIKNLLVLDPKLRFSADQALNHPWLNNSNHKSLDLSENLIKFSGHCKLKRAALRVIADSLTSNQISELQHAFEEVDTTHCGQITVEQLREVMEKRDLHQVLAQVHEQLSNVKIPKGTLIDYTELLNSTIKRSNFLTHERMFTAFKHFDRDDNGFISPEDMREVLGRDTNLEEYFTGIPKIKDNKIDFDQFCELMVASTPLTSGPHRQIWE